MIEDGDMELTEEIEENKDVRVIEAGDLETNERENTNTSPRRANVGKGVERLKMKFGGKTYDTQFTTSTEKKRKDCMHDMHHQRVVAGMYKNYTQLEYIKLMGSLNPDILTRSQKKVPLRDINLI